MQYRLFLITRRMDINLITKVFLPETISTSETQSDKTLEKKHSYILRTTLLKQSLVWTCDQ